MTDLAAAAHRVRVAPAVGARGRIAALLLAAALGTGIGIAATDPAETMRALARSGSELAMLLRFMAAMKAVMALAALAGVSWRLRLPVTFPRFMLYAAAAATMSTGPGLIWGLVHVGPGAVLLHAGLAACVVLLWRDPTLGSHLSALVASRRRDLGRL